MGTPSNHDIFYDPAEYAKKIRDSVDKTEDQKYESELSSVIDSLLSDYNNRNVDATNRHLEEIRSALEADIDGNLNIKFGGSVAKHTYVDGLSDIDSLVLLNKSDLSNKSPEEVKTYFFQRLNDRFPKTEITSGKLAITLKFSDGKEIQLLPAIKQGASYKIASGSSKNIWATINPSRFAASLSAMNKKMSNKLVPVIKLVKSIIADLPTKRQLSGYHTESLALKCFKSYDGEKKIKDMLIHFFDKSSAFVRNPITDKTGQSTHVDDYLSSRDSLPRKMVSDSLAQISRKMKNANLSRSLDQWNNILNNE